MTTSLQKLQTDQNRKNTQKGENNERERTPDATPERVVIPSCSYKTSEEIKPFPQALLRKKQNPGRKPCKNIENQFENEREEEHFLTGVMSVNDYVVVRFSTEKTVTHYSGKVMEITEKEDLVNFLRRKKPAYHCVFPDVTVQSMIGIEDATRLPISICHKC
ncbi:hypothetical protein WA026_021668 [Henosepilachna vigintioctopunctata]|uniref:Uncharacterized protein n=1 Tax=Henosepilachna vigintioctopunctata TaxID=420089 RepID=A0AAW1UCM5_9CUCU